MVNVSEPFFWPSSSPGDPVQVQYESTAYFSDDSVIIPTPEFLNTVLAPFPMTVAQTLDIQNLGYEYAVEVIS